MDSLAVRPLPVRRWPREATPPPFWSPDGRFVAWIPAENSRSWMCPAVRRKPCAISLSVSVGGTWNRDGDIIVGNIAGGLLRVRETGGIASPVTTLDPAPKEEFHLLPTFLPDGRHFVYLRVSPSAPEANGSYIGTLDAKPEKQTSSG